MPATKKNIQKLTLPVNKYFDQEEAIVVRVLHDITIGTFEQLGIKF